jgi:hypothetical protein
MKRSWAIRLAVGVVSLLMVGFYLSKAGHTPGTQPAMVEMNDEALSALQTEFNRTDAGLRVILLLSPT